MTRDEHGVNRRSADSSEAGPPASRPSAQHGPSRSSDLRGAAVFTGLALVFSWLVMIPLWVLVGGEPVYGGPGADADSSADAAASGDPAAVPAPDEIVRILLLQLFPAVMMLTPALAAWITVRWVDGVRFRRMFAALGLTIRRGGDAEGTTSLRSVGAGPTLPPGGGRHPLVAILLWSGVAIIATPVLVGLTVAVAAALGFLDIDWDMPVLAPQASASGIPVMVLLLIQVLSVPVAAVLPNGLLAAGEEIGWRGYLLPRLIRLWGMPVAVLVSGLVWGAWHAPVVLLGYNFARPHVGGVLLMIAGCIAVGAWLTWLTVRSGTVWPAVFGHGALNASAGFFLILSATPDVDAAVAGPLGVAGWIVFGVTAVVLLRFFARRRSTGSRS